MGTPEIKPEGKLYAALEPFHPKGWGNFVKFPAFAALIVAGWAAADHAFKKYAYLNGLRELTAAQRTGLAVACTATPILGAERGSAAYVDAKRREAAKEQAKQMQEASSTGEKDVPKLEELEKQLVQLRKNIENTQSKGETSCKKHLQEIELLEKEIKSANEQKGLLEQQNEFLTGQLSDAKEQEKEAKAETTRLRESLEVGLERHAEHLQALQRRLAEAKGQAAKLGYHVSNGHGDYTHSSLVAGGGIHTLPPDSPPSIPTAPPPKAPPLPQQLLSECNRTEKGRKTRRRKKTKKDPKPVATPTITTTAPPKAPPAPTTTAAPPALPPRDHKPSGETGGGETPAPSDPPTTRPTSGKGTTTPGPKTETNGHLLAALATRRGNLAVSVRVENGKGSGQETEEPSSLVDSLFVVNDPAESCGGEGGSATGPRTSAGSSSISTTRGGGASSPLEAIEKNTSCADMVIQKKETGSELQVAAPESETIKAQNRLKKEGIAAIPKPKENDPKEAWELYESYQTKLPTVLAALKTLVNMDSFMLDDALGDDGIASPDDVLQLVEAVKAGDACYNEARHQGTVREKREASEATRKEREAAREKRIAKAKKKRQEAATGPTEEVALALAKQRKKIEGTRKPPSSGVRQEGS